MSYILLRSMKVQLADGTVEMRQPGAACPEAENWPNPGVWIKRGYLRLAKEGVVPAYDRKKLQPAREATPADKTRSEAKAPPLPQAPEGPLAELLQLSRKDLNSLAKDYEVKQTKKTSDEELAEAILAAQSKE